ncbi:hypothetical protein [Acidocella sp.]|jgi:hypothetical protein|uniref:hypothetical protein n=1 Tax=Acidocella sp. TaxID=50710 RepID=UPI002F412521
MRQIISERARHAAQNRETARAIDAARAAGAQDLVEATYAKRAAERKRHLKKIADLERKGREV